MAGLLKERSLSALIVTIIMGIIIGSFLNSFVAIIPGGANVVKTFFTHAIPLGIGDFVNNKPLLIDLSAIKFQIGFQIKFSLLSLIGLVVSLYLFRWYR
ncbi:MAG: DUF4321 domain-containing protein [Chitinispirillaceae bacterium]|jgi:hypothetical protein